MGDGEKLTHLNSALKVLLGSDIFPRVPKKKLNFVDQCNPETVSSTCNRTMRHVLGKGINLCEQNYVQGTVLSHKHFKALPL